MDTIITKRRYRWIGHVLRKDPHSTSRTTLHRTYPRGEEKEGQPKTSRRTVETEMDRQEWRKFVAALHTPWGVKDDDNDMPHYTSIRLLKTI